MEEVAVAVENNFCDTGGESLLGSSLAYLGGDFNLGAFLDSLGGCRHEGLAFLVIDELHVDLLVGAEHCHAGTSSSARHLPADAGFDLISSLYLGYHDSACFNYLAPADLPDLRRITSPTNLIPLPL